MISRMIKRFDKAPRDGKNGENEQDRGKALVRSVYKREGGGGRDRGGGET